MTVIIGIIYNSRLRQVTESQSGKEYQPHCCSSHNWSLFTLTLLPLIHLASFVMLAKYQI